MQVMDIVIDSLPLILILCLGVFVQSAAGFAAGLTIIPALLWFGYSIPAAQCALLVASIPQNIWGVWSFRDSIMRGRHLASGWTTRFFSRGNRCRLSTRDARHPNHPANSWWAIDCVNALDLVVPPKTQVPPPPNLGLDRVPTLWLHAGCSWHGRSRHGLLGASS